MKKILIVEDELAYVKLLSDVFTQNYEVLDAADGKEGLKMALKEHPDLILLDIKMPVMDGMKMLKELRKDSWGKNAKVILLTNIEPSSEIIEGAVNDHPLFYLIKSDIKLEDVTKKVKKLLE